MGFIKKATKFFLMRAVEGIFVLALILIMPSLPPYGNYSSYTITPPTPLEGKLAPNHLLENAEKLFENKIAGPESFADYNGELYFGLVSGEVMKINKHDELETVVTFHTKKCEGFYTENECGRPLGLEFDKNGNLYVIDTYTGLWKVNVKTGQKKLIISSKDEIDGKPVGTPNSLSLASNGDIYWTDSSSDYQLRDILYSLFTDGTGRLFRYNAATKQNEVLIDKLYFANGVHLSEKEDFVIVVDLLKSRILRYYLKGPKKGTHDVFVDGLPGLPDNISSNKRGGYFVGLVLPRDDQTPTFPQIVSRFPLIRKLVARLFGLADFGFKTVNDYYPIFLTKFGEHVAGNFKPLPFITPKRATVVELDNNGNIINSYHSLDGTIRTICEGYIFGEYMYLGSPYNEYLARVKLSKLGLADRATKNVPPVQKPTTTTTSRPQTTTPKPTTTTSRPTTTSKPQTTTTAKPQTTTTPKPQTTTTPKPQTTTPKPQTTTTPKPQTTTTPKPRTTTTPKPQATTTQKSQTTTSPKPTQTAPPPKVVSETKKEAPSTGKSSESGKNVKHEL